MVTKTSVKHSGTWRDVRADGLYVRHAGSWRTVQQAYVKHSGTWRLVHQQSDPLTIVFTPIWANSFGEGHLEEPQFTILGEGNGLAGYGLVQGDWDTVGHPSGMQRAYGVIRYDHAAIAAAFGGRTQVTACSLRLTNRNAYDGAASAKIHTSTTAFTNTRPTSLGAAPQKSHTATSAVMTDGATTTTTLVNAIGEGFISGLYRAIILYDGGTSEVDKGLYRFIAGDATSVSARQPVLSITADY